MSLPGTLQPVQIGAAEQGTGVPKSFSGSALQLDSLEIGDERYRGAGVITIRPTKSSAAAKRVGIGDTIFLREGTSSVWIDFAEDVIPTGATLTATFNEYQPGECLNELQPRTVEVVRGAGLPDAPLSQSINQSVPSSTVTFGFNATFGKASASLSYLTQSAVLQSLSFAETGGSTSWTLDAIRYDGSLVWSDTIDPKSDGTITTHTINTEIPDLFPFTLPLKENDIPELVFEVTATAIITLDIEARGYRL